MKILLILKNLSNTFKFQLKNIADKYLIYKKEIYFKYGRARATDYKRSSK